MNILNSRIAPTNTSVIIYDDTTIACAQNAVVSLTISPTATDGALVAAVVYTVGNDTQIISRAPGRNPLTYPATFDLHTVPVSGTTIYGSAVVYDSSWITVSSYDLQFTFTNISDIPTVNLLETTSNNSDNTVLIVGESYGGINTIHLWASRVSATTPTATAHTVSSITLTTTLTAATATGSALASEGTLVFVSNMGRAAYAQFTTVAKSITAEQADNLVFAGGYNYLGTEAGVTGSVPTYAYYVDASAAWPVIGRTELGSSTLTQTSTQVLLTYGSDWRWTTDTENVYSTWTSEVSATSAWAVSATEIGYEYGNPTAFATNIASAYGDCTNNPVTSLYAQTTFEYVSGSKNSIRFQVNNSDATVLYLNGVRIGTNNTVTNLPYVVCDTNDAVATDHYFPISALNVGTNILSLELYRAPSATSMMFDVQVTIGNIVNQLPAYYGAPSQTHTSFSYVPAPKTYYSKVLDGDVELFVLDVSRKQYTNCLAHNQQYGVTVGSEQYQWFADAVAASTARWKIVSLYDPWENSVADRSTLPSMVDWGFKAHGIDLVIAGAANGINEHLIINGLHVVNLGVDTFTPTNVNNVTTSPFKVWQDVTNLVSGVGAPAFVAVNATPTHLTVTIKRADTTRRVLRQFAIT